MRIVYIINAFLHAGAEKLACNLALQLSGRVEYIGILALYRRDDETENMLRKSLSSVGIDTAVLGKRAGKDRLYCFREIYRYIRKNRIELIHLHCAPAPMLLGKAAGRMAGVSVVCTIHNIRGYGLERFTSWLTDKYISIGEGTRKYMTEKLRIPEKKISAIYNGVNTEQLLKAQKKDNFWEAYGGNPKEQAILNVGRVCEQKNQICILRALRRCEEQGLSVRLYILGAYEEEDPVYREMRRYIREHALSGRVEFLGTRTDIEEFYANADCFVQTSSYEGFSMAQVEAIISGCPVIATVLPAVLEANSIAECITVIPQDDDVRLAEILSQKAYRRQTDNTVSLFAKRFSLSRAAEEHYEQYTIVRYGKK